MEENNDLHSEIVRLNRIISGLLDLIEVLRSENDNLRNRKRKKGENTSSNSSEGENILNNLASNSPVDGQNLKNVTPYSPVEGNNLKNVTPYSPVYGQNLKNVTPYSPVEGNNLKNVTPYSPVYGQNLKNITSNSPIDGEILKNIASASSANAPATTNTVSLVAPDQIELSDINAQRLGNRLKKYFSKVSRKEDMYPRFGSQLLFMHNNGTATTKELRKLIGLSESGFAKHFPRLKKKNFVYKQAPYKYALTQLSKDIINEVFGVAQ